MQAVHFPSNGSLVHRKALPERGGRRDGASFTSQMGQQWTFVLRGDASGTECLRWSLPDQSLVTGSHSSVNLNMFTQEFAPTGSPEGLDQWPLPKAWLQASTADRLLVFDKLTNIFAIKGSVSSPFVTLYHVTTFYTTS